MLPVVTLSAVALALGLTAAAPGRPPRPQGDARSGERILVDYFLENQTPRHLVLDRSSDRTTASVAATGFGYFAWAVAVEDGLLDRAEAIRWMTDSIDLVARTTPKRNRGWLYHWTDAEGNPKLNKEVSSIDTVLFWGGAKRAAEKLKDPGLLRRVADGIAAIDRPWMQTNGGRRPDKRLFSHGLVWDDDGTAAFYDVDWDERYSEGVLVYRLLGVPPPTREVALGLPLFVYYYPLCLFPDDPEYQATLRAAVRWQLSAYGYCGMTACDGPVGYVVGDPRVVSPLSVWACSVVSEEAGAFLGRMRHDRTTPSYSVDGTWVARDRIGIDSGSTLMMLRR
jgi:hypothetical protein